MFLTDLTRGAVLLLLATLVQCSPSKPAAESKAGKDTYDASKDSLRYAGEVRLRNIRQLTYGGNNAEAYWSFDDKQLVFQSEWKRLTGQGCDQIFTMPARAINKEENPYQLVSTGKGRTTCGYFLKDGRIVYASTHAGGDACPSFAPFGGGRYVWPIFDSYDIYVSNADGSGTKALITGPGYDAEATASPDGKYVIFTSTRSGDLELWRYDLQTGETLQLTNEPGYDGGAFFSRDSKKIVWRASRPKGEGLIKYQELLKNGMVEPSDMTLYIADIDGKNVQQVTNLPGANWAPFFHPDGKRIIFASNHHTMGQGGRIFDLFLINIDGTNLEQVTHTGTFDAFPMFSYDGTKLVFASNRNVSRSPTRDTNIFIADWVENPSEADRNFGRK
jgi:Tol biopolymer transport system component